MTLNVEWLLVPDGLVWIFKKLLIYWDFQAQPSLGFTENENIAWFDESRFLLRHSDGRFRILNKKHEIMDPSCLVSMVQDCWWWCNVVWDIFLAHFVHLSTN